MKVYKNEDESIFVVISKGTVSVWTSPDKKNFQSSRNANIRQININ